MSCIRLLEKLRERDISIWEEDGKLRYTAPRGALTEELRAEIAAYRADLLVLLSASRAGEIRRAPRQDGRRPLSYGQEQLWFIDQLNPGSVAYNVALQTRVRGELDPSALRLALREIVRRHEPLGVSFTSTDGSPVVSVGEPPAAVLLEASLEDVPAPDRLAEVLRRGRADRQRPFDLTRGPLFRATLYRLAEGDHVFDMTVHHIVWDAFSSVVFLRELLPLHDAFRAGRPSPLEALEISYLDFAHWQRQRFEDRETDDQVEYWKRQLRDLPELEIPTDRPRPPAQTVAGAAKRRRLQPDLTRSLAELSQREGVTLYQTLVSTFFVLLSGYTGQSDIVIGTPVSGRSRRELQPLLGLFVDSIVLRCDLSGDPPFRELLGRVRDTVIAGLAHDSVPFEKVVQELRPERRQDRNPLFQVQFNYLDSSGLPKIESSLRLEPVTEDPAAELQSARLDLSMLCARGGSGLDVFLEYKTALFDGSTIERMLEQYVELLRRIVESPEQSVSRLLTLEDTTAQAECLKLPPPAAAEPDLLAELDRAFRRFAADPAILAGSRAIPFADLDRAADRIASALLDGGLPAGGTVAVALRERPQVIAALLGVWRAGGVFVPLDPDGPGARIRSIVEEVRPHAVVAQRIDSGIGGGERPATIVLESPSDSGWCEGTSYPSGRSLGTFDPPGQRVAIEPQAMAYVYYTSGSTGRPKGIAGTLRGVGHFVRWEIDTFELGPGTRVSQLTVPTFDAFFRDVLVPLCAGGTVSVPPDALHPDPRQLLAWIDEVGVNVVHTVPSLFAALAAEARDPDRLRSLRHVFLAGEVLPVAVVRDWMAVFGTRIQLVNLYGPTETTMTKLCHVVQPADLERGFIPIGKPMPGAQAVLLDDAGNIRLRGAVGQLHIRSRYRTLGYYDQPELTRSAFVRNPFRDDPEDLLYRTGDLARELNDGSFRFVGRKDNQIKIRGVRVELEEIEAALREYPDVGAAVAIAREVGAGDLQLVAYVVPKAGAVDVLALRAFLAERLPQPMLPVACVTLESLPRLPNGKVDRKALPAPDLSGEEESFVAPRDGTEEVLCAIWRDVLNVDRVGVHDDFFELGGHSLLATQLTSRIRSTLQIEVPLRELFDCPTVAELTRRIQFVGARPATPVLVPRHADGDLPLSFAQQRLWFLDRMGVGTAYNMKTAVRLRGRLEVERLEQVLQEIVRRHEALRTSFPLVDGQPVQRIAGALEFRLRRIDLSDLESEPTEAAVLRLAQEESDRPFDLSTGPLVRGELLKLGEQEHVLLFTMHHIISDRWSRGVLVRELTTLYEAFSDGQASPLPELRIQYGDFALWQRGWLAGEALEQQLSYWREQLADVATLDLPTDRTRPAVQTFVGDSYGLEIPPELCRALKRLSRENGLTLAMLLLAGWQILLSRYSGQDDIAVGSPIANRTQEALEPLIGCFVNTLVLRTDLSGDPTIEEVLRRVRDVSLSAYENQDLPFEQVVEVLNPQRDLSRHPLFQVIFAMQNVPREALRLGDLEIGQLRLPATTTGFDLELHFVEYADRLVGGMVYNVDLFDASRVARMSDHLIRVLAGIAADPSRRVSELNLLSEEERRQIFVEWNDTAAAYPDGACIHELFEAQVERTPEAVAVISDERSLTYRQLHERANRVAHTLQGLGVGVESLVALCMERSPEMVEGLLGILKAGAAYLPLDPSYPAARLEYMIQDSGATILLTQESLLERLAGTAVRTLCLDRDRALFAAAPDTNPERRACADNLAYVIYTSGSTGTPKGTWLSHRGLCSLSAQQSRAFGVGPGSRVLQFSSLSFDASTMEIVMALPKGAALVLGTSETLLPGPNLLSFLRRHRVSITLLPPAALAATPVEPLPDLGTLLVGGEACPIELARRWAPGRRFFNLYGPTEATIVSTMTPLGEDVQAIHIGRPIDNIQTYILDRTLRPVPVGVVGELYVAGVGLARGYLDRPDLTAERFVPNPFATEPGRRMYRTGDQARYRADGNIDFIGRVDHQVKLRGFRIELGEIETVLEQHAAVDQAVALVREHRPGDRRIVAYVVLQTRDGNSPQAEMTREIAPQLREHVAAALPEYMVPSSFVILETLPMTPNGKLDRSALPDPDWHRPAHAPEALALPRTPTERLLADIWKEVIGIDEVGLYDNFFDLGGHSLLMVQAATRIQEQTGVSIQLREYMVSNLVQLAQAYDVAVAERQRPPEVAPSPDTLGTRLRSLVSRVVPTRRTT